MSAVRPFSVPERLSGFGVLAGAAAVVWPALTASTGLGLPCGMRTLFGIPCPACGMTTAAVALMRGDAGGALRANPVIFGLAAVTVVAGTLVVLRAMGIMNPPRPWPPAWRRRVGRLAGLLAAASWLYQLHRLGVQPGLVRMI
ncbi:DUF2752 domain-containing protein [Actinoplanes sp. NPDC051851]|uniref:DUF2752 domain-containing protein n=1 Tax=Actinoplanes sp. NPDC051851 TaxID=3154753 RepID=UPI003422D7ED